MEPGHTTEKVPREAGYQEVVLLPTVTEGLGGLKKVPCHLLLAGMEVQRVLSAGENPLVLPFEQATIPLVLAFLHPALEEGQKG